jgi:DnaK suppressor protein
MAQKSATKKNASDDNKALTKKDLKSFKNLLSEKREALLSAAQDTRKTGFEPSEKHPDEVDLATAEYEQSFEYRMRDREKYLVKKIDKALQRIEVGEYDECESCGELISKKRLLARPEATLCIVCKEEQEQIEKGFLKRRELNNQQYNN